ncbi:TPA: hypothetical protein ACKP0L_001508 [Pseudomonas putida]
MLLNNYLAFANFSFVPLSHIKDTKMKSAQHNGSVAILIHPTACSSVAKIQAFERSTGLQLVVTLEGKAHAVPANGGAA